MKDLTISIVSYNSKDLFITLDSLKKVVTENTEVVVYDNGSESDYLKKIQKYDFVRLIEGGENKGFGYGHNRVLLHSDSRYGLICNPDIIVSDGVIERLLEKLKSAEGISTVVPKVLNTDGTTQFLVRERLDVFDYVLRFQPFDFIREMFSKRLARFECRDLPDDQDTFINMGSGCFMLVDLEKYQEIGGFDERFFMYFEDNDLCLRFGKSGYKILYSPSTTVTHLYGKGAHRSFKLFRIFIRSMFKFFNKWGWSFF